jgi:hypothetical protein
MVSLLLLAYDIRIAEIEIKLYAKPLRVVAVPYAKFWNNLALRKMLIWLAGHETYDPLKDAYSSETVRMNMDWTKEIAGKHPGAIWCCKRPIR